MGWRDTFGFADDVIRGKHARTGANSGVTASNSSCDTQGESQDELDAAQAGTPVVAHAAAMLEGRPNGVAFRQPATPAESTLPATCAETEPLRTAAGGGSPAPRSNTPVDISTPTQRTHMVSLRLAESDYRELQRACKELGLDRSTYLRYIIRAGAIEDTSDPGRTLVIDRTAMMAAVREMVTWGRHYNQAVHALSTIALRMNQSTRIDRAWLQEQLDGIQIQLGMVEDGKDDVLSSLERFAKLPAIRGN